MLWFLRRSNQTEKVRRFRKLLNEQLEGRRVLAPIPLTLAPYSENFDSLANTGTTNSALPAGWEFSESLANLNTSYRADNGTLTTGDTYSYGATGSSERAFGTLQSGSLISIVGASFSNSTANSFTSFTVAYSGEQWRVGAASRPDRLDFQYSTNASSLTDTAATWIDVDTLDFNSIQSATVGARDGNSNKTAISGVIPATIAAGSVLYIRWNDFNATGSDDGMAVDDFTIQASSQPSLSITVDSGSNSKPEGSTGSTSFTYTVTRSGPSTDQLTVDWVVAGNGQYATDSSDFQGAMSGNLTFAAGVTTQSVTVNVSADTTIEPDESFRVTLSNAVNVSSSSTGVTLGASTADSIAVNDDFQPLSPGDLLITGINSTNPDQFSFVPLVDLAGNQPIKFSDNGWDSSLAVPQLVQTEGVVTYVTPSAGLPKGTKVVIEATGIASTIRTGPGSSNISGNFALNSTGENLFAFLGGISNPQFLFGVNTGVSYLASGAGAITNATSYLPPGLSVGTSAVEALGLAGNAVVANGEYNHSVLVGDKAQLNAAVSTVGNWTVSSSAIALNTNSFTVSNQAGVSIQATAVGNPEGNSGSTAYSFTVTRTGTGLSAETVDFVVTGSGANPATASDFAGGVLPSGSISFPADGTLTKTITINVSGDTVIELDESFVVTLQNPSSGLAIGNASSTGVIANDDLPNLNAGDILITGINATNPDQFSFVPLVDLPGNSQIIFTDNGWDGSALATSEGAVIFVVPASGMIAGTKVSVTANTVATVNVGTAAIAGNFALNAAGENLFAYIGPSASPTFLYGVNTNVSYLTSGSISASTTYLPPALSLGLSALPPLGTTAAVANAEYNHSIRTSGSPNQLRTSVGSSANWSTSASAISLSSTNFSVINTLIVESLSTSASSVSVRFAKSTDIAKLNIVDSNNANGATDVTLVGNTVGAVKGSVILDADNKGFTFIKTGGPLDADTYTLTLRSASNGLTDTAGNLLDGDSNNVAGGDFVQQFTVTAPASGAITLRVGDFVRGYGQPVNLPANSTNGLPITISTGVNVTGASFRLNYDPNLLTITGGTTSIAGATITVDTSVAGRAVVNVTSSTQFSSTAGLLTLVNLAANIPNTAPNGAKGLLTISNVTLTSANASPLVSSTDDGYLIAAYKGDVNNNRAINTGDVTGLLRTISGALSTTGFPGLKLADPTLVGDMNDSSTVTSGDVTGLLRFISGASGGFPAIPALPSGITPPTPGADPQVFVPQNLVATPGSTIVVPININVTEASGASVAGIDVSFTYDTTRFSFASVSTGSALAGFSFSSSNNTATNGFARLVYAADVGPQYVFGFVGTLLNVTLNVLPGAASGASPLNLTAVGLSDNDTNDLLISPPITPGVDSSDGIITIPGAGNSAPTDIALSSSTIAENAGANATVGTLSTTDPDSGNTFTYTLVTGTGSTDNAAFNISGNTLRATASLDFESKSSYSVRVRTTDQGGLFFEKAFTITVTNVNETPVFNPASYTFSLPENSAASTAVGTVTATDPDAGTTLTYSLGGTGASNFVINSTTGAITVAAGATLNFEGTNTWSLTATVSDGTLSATAPVTINLTNVNEAPVFNPTSYTFSLPENSATATAVGTVTATDPDAGTTLTYSLSGTGASNFVINSTTGAITVAAGATLNFEGTNTWSLTATVSDGTLSATAPVTINLTNVNEAPVFNPTSYTFSLPENSATATAVGTVTATDPDAGTTLTYSLSGTGASNFVINSTTGAITVAAGATLNFEGTNTWSLTATVSDGTLSATAPVTINLTNVNETPVFNPSSYTFNVPENSATGAAVGTVTATDPDAGSTLTYSLQGVGAGNFVINASTGAITVAAGAVLNFEGTTSFSLSANVTDGTLSSTAAVTIEVTNVNEPPVFVPANFTFSLPENSAASTAVGTVTATDPDAGTTLTYSLSGTGASNFVINSTTGAITVAAGATLNFEGTNTWSLTATVSDGTLSATAPVTINLTNVNEAPVFNPSSYTFSLPENTAASTAVGTVTATDPDAGTTLTYSLSGTGSSNFVINSTTGAITVAAGATLNFEGTNTWSLTATVSDGTLSATAPVTINLTNVNEAPVFNPTSYTFSLPENSATATAVGTVTATDPDAGTTLTYSLSGTGASNFVINSTTGAITVAAGATLNFEGTNTWSLTATVSDGTLSATAPVTINLTNVNEAPVFNPASYTFSLPENSAASTAVGTVTATDPDAGTTLTYSLSGTGSSNFVINSTTGAITVAAGASFNSVTTPSYNLTVTASDGSLSSTAGVTVSVTAAAPSLTSVSVNGGDTFKNSSQRSELTSLVIAFSAPVVVSAGAFTIQNIGLTSAQSPVDLAQSQIIVTADASQMVYTIRFGSGSGVVTRSATNGTGRGNSLVDGNYVLSIDPSKVTRNGVNLSSSNNLGDGDNQFGDLATDSFFRMFGDGNGDGVVSTSDTGLFRASLTAYDAAFDADGDGFVLNSGVDRSDFLGNFGKRRRSI